MGSFYSKYVIIGNGLAGMTLTSLMANKPYQINGDQITLIDYIPDYTNYSILKYHCFAIKNTNNTNQSVAEIVPPRVKFRPNEILQICPEENLLLGEGSLRLSYEKLILACGLEPDFSYTPGLLYSLKDKLNPIFSIYEYEEFIPKMCNYSSILIKRFFIEPDFKLTKQNEEFLKNGNGNIVFVNCTDDIYEIVYNIQMIILCYDLIKYYRKEEFLNKVKFILSLPINKETFLNFEDGKNISQFFYGELQKRNIEIKWESKLVQVGNHQNFIFENKEELFYNYAFVMPKLVLPSFLRFNKLFENLEVQHDFKLKNFDNIYVVGDALTNVDSPSNNFVDRFDISIYKQVKVLSDNLKVDHFRLQKDKKKVYQPSSKFYFDYREGEYTLIDTKESYENSVKSFKKNFWNNFLINQFRNKPETYIARKYFLDKIFGVKI